jgi:hypothetical protein
MNHSVPHRSHLTRHNVSKLDLINKKIRYRAMNSNMLRLDIQIHLIDCEKREISKYKDSYKRNKIYYKFSPTWEQYKIVDSLRCINKYFTVYMEFKSLI